MRSSSKTITEDSQTVLIANDQSNLKKTYDVVISGAGPAGLATAWHAAKAGQTVLLISKHPVDFLRVQSVLLEEENIAWLKEIYQEEKNAYRAKKKKHPVSSEDDKFLRSISHHLYVFSIKDIERFIMRRLYNLRDSCIIDLMDNSSLTAVDLEKGTATVQQTESGKSVEHLLEFQYLIGADGAHRHALTVLQSTLPQPMIEYVSYSHSIPNHHAGAYLTVKRANHRSLCLPGKEAFYRLQENGQMAMLSLNKEGSHYRKHRNEIKCYVTLVIPEEIYMLKEVERKKKILEMMHKFIQSTFDEWNLGNGTIETNVVKNSSRKQGEKKDRLKFIVFKTNPERASKIYIENSGHYFMLIGDAMYNPDHRTGSGVNNALVEARHLKNFFMQSNDLNLKKINLTKYTDSVSKVVSSSIIMLSELSKLSGAPVINQKEELMKIEELHEEKRMQHKKKNKRTYSFWTRLKEDVVTGASLGTGFALIPITFFLAPILPISIPLAVFCGLCLGGAIIRSIWLYSKSMKANDPPITNTSPQSGREVQPPPETKEKAITSEEKPSLGLFHTWARLRRECFCCSNSAMADVEGPKPKPIIDKRKTESIPALKPNIPNMESNTLRKDSQINMGRIKGQGYGR